MTATPAHAYTVLVVDDMEAMRKLICRNLDQAGCRTVLQAANGVEALALLQNRPGIDALITDWNMPMMSGIELLRAVRAHPTLHALPVLMVTGEMSRPEVEEAIAAGVSSFLVKPFTVGNLQARLTQILGADRIGTAAPARVARRPPPMAGDVQQVPVLASPWPDVDTDTDAVESAPCVLVVDDSVDTIDVLVGLLRHEYRVIAATRGSEALRLVESERPDLILLDVVMPEMDGFAVCRQLRADPKHAETPVVFLTANDDAGSVVDGLRLGAVDYIAKPVEPLVLLARVRGQIARHQAFAVLQRQLQLEAENARLREQVERMARHDLKSPIGGIVNFADELMRFGGLSAEQSELVAAIHESAWSVLDLINLSLDLYRIERGAFELHPVRVELFELMKRILKERQAEILGKRLHPSLSARDGGDARVTACTVLGDPLLAYSLFANLVKNAVEAAPIGGRLTIALESQGGDHVEVRISNSGVVPETIRECFFEKFSTAGKVGGTGLGTYSARLFAEAQGGSIAMVTRDAEGDTTVTVTLPYASA
ncbi:MAG TPA: hybrid sensor histidine kinase/response regulator [Arenimonas sp.]|nr:hybrid sensor histidine kinase/response regulator [Arenimonas sp.]